MSVLSMSNGTCPEGPVAASDDEKGMIGKAFRGVVAGTVLSLGAVLALAPAPAMALVYEVQLDTSVGSDDPGGPGPWLKATFTDIFDGGAVIGVNVTLETIGLVAGEYINGFYFYMDPLVTPIVEYVSGQQVSGYDFTEATEPPQPTGNLLSSAARFDAFFDYPESNAPNPDTTLDRFIMNELSSYNLLHKDLSTANIVFSSSEEGYYVGAKLQGISGGGSTSIVGTSVSEVPIPPAALLFLTGLAGMGLLARRRRARLGGAAA